MFLERVGCPIPIATYSALLVLASRMRAQENLLMGIPYNLDAEVIWRFVFMC